MAERPLGGAIRGRTTGEFGGDQATYYERMDRVRWGPILAGVFVTLSMTVLLGLLGLAVQAALGAMTDPGEATGWGWLIWGVIVLLVSFGAGGWIAARSAALKSEQSGLLNGGMVWAVAIPVMFYLLPTLFGTLMGPAAMMAQGAMGQQQQQQPGQPGQIFGIEQQQPGQQPMVEESEVDTAANVATWGTLIGLLLGLGAAAGGGYFAGKSAEKSYAEHRGHDYREPGPPPPGGYGSTGTTTTTHETGPGPDVGPGSGPGRTPPPHDRP